MCFSFDLFTSIGFIFIVRWYLLLYVFISSGKILYQIVLLFLTNDFIINSLRDLLNLSITTAFRFD